MVNIFIANLDWDVTSEDLKTTFSAFGSVAYAHVVYEKKTKRSKGFGYVEMEEMDNALAAIDALNEVDVNGRKLDVKLASPKTNRPEKKEYVAKPFEKKPFKKFDDNRGGGSSYGSGNKYGNSGGYGSKPSFNKPGQGDSNAMKSVFDKLPGKGEEISLKSTSNKNFDSLPDGKNQSRSEIKTDYKSDYKTDEKPDFKPDYSSENRTEEKSDYKLESKPERIMRPRRKNM